MREGMLVTVLPKDLGRLPDQLSDSGFTPNAFVVQAVMNNAGMVTDGFLIAQELPTEPGLLPDTNLVKAFGGSSRFFYFDLDEPHSVDNVVVPAQMPLRSTHENWSYLLVDIDPGAAKTLQEALRFSAEDSLMPWPGELAPRIPLCGPSGCQLLLRRLAGLLAPLALQPTQQVTPPKVLLEAEANS